MGVGHRGDASPRRLYGTAILGTLTFLVSPMTLSPAHRRVLDDALALVRDQRQRAEAGGAPFTPDLVWTGPFGLGYLLGAVDGLCQTAGVPFGDAGLAVWALVLDDTFGPETADGLRAQATDALQAEDPAFARGRAWGGNEAVGAARGQHTPVGLVHLARGDQDRMGAPRG